MADEAEVNDDLVSGVMEMVTSTCARHDRRRGARIRVLRVLTAKQQLGPAEAAG